MSDSSNLLNQVIPKNGTQCLIIEIDSMEELPIEIKSLLKSKREVSEEFTLNSYRGILVSDKIYVNKEYKWYPEEIKLCIGTLKLVYMLDAVISNGKVLKNRYGHID